VGGHVEKLGYYGIAHSLNEVIENLFAHGVVVVPHTTITDLFTLPGVVVTHMRNEPHGLENREVVLCEGGVMRAKLAAVVA
jgi:hypothetical protein